MTDVPADAIRVRGARQNNLKNLDLAIPLNELVVVTGVSGSGKSSLVFDTLYAEGQRRYVETFSPYARQFLDRMDKPQVDSISGIPPAIAIDQTNPVRTSRSTVGTMTELNDHLKLLFARAAQLFCRHCGKAVCRDSPESMYADMRRRAELAGDPRLIVCFPVPVPKNFKEAEVRELLQKQGYTRFFEDVPSTRKRARKVTTLEVVQDRLRVGSAESSRVLESLEAALRVGRGRINIHVVAEGDPPPRLDSWRYSSELHCAECDLSYREPVPSLFSFNSPLGACESCRGFGRTMGIDYGLVIPDESKSLRAGAIRPWQTESNAECQEDLQKFAKKRGIPLDRPWRELSAAQRQWVIEGEGAWKKGVWYGARRFFAWLETKAYKMHVRVLLSRYRAYTPCTVCDGARLKPDALLWRIGTRELADSVLPPAKRMRPPGVDWSAETLQAQPGLSIHDLMLLPIERACDFMRRLALPPPLDAATDLLLGEIRARFIYLSDVGLGYLTLDRQSRTLSGGEVQRINLTTALGTSLVNTLFVLDEPSIGLHPRDMRRVIAVMKRLRDAGNSLVVVEHNPQIMLEADRILDMGPGAGERGGEVVFFGTPAAIKKSAQSLTGDYLSGRKLVVAPRVPRRASSEVVAEWRPNRWLELRGARAHNLQNVDVRIPLKRLVCVTGVSGSGKSTLIEDVLYPALLKYQGRPTIAPGEFDGLRGADLIDDVVMVDQITHRAHDALEPRKLRRCLRRYPRALRMPSRWRAGTQVHRRHVQLQLRRTAAVPPAAATASSTSRCSSSKRRVSALPRLQRQPLPQRGARHQARRRRRPPRKHRRSARHDGDAGARLLRRFTRDRRASDTACRCGPGIREARPAGADAFRRRGAAPEACRPSCSRSFGRLEHYPSGETLSIR
jgi:excinuclease ABC subunit A